MLARVIIHRKSVFQQLRRFLLRWHVCQDEEKRLLTRLASTTKRCNVSKYNKGEMLPCPVSNVSSKQRWISPKLWSLALLIITRILRWTFRQVGRVIETTVNCRLKYLYTMLFFNCGLVQFSQFSAMMLWQEDNFIRLASIRYFQRGARFSFWTFRLVSWHEMKLRTPLKVARS